MNLKQISNFFMVILGAVCFMLPAHARESADTSGDTVYVIPVSGMVEPGMAAYVKRALAQIEDDSDAMVLFKMDTFGGRVDSAFEIVETISTIPKERSIAYVEKRAISAGALIALAAGTLVMKENTLIGDCAPIIQSQEGQIEAGEKTQTVLRAQFRTQAKRNGYPEALSEAMVTKDMEVYKVVMDGQTRYMDKVAFEDLTESEKSKITEKRTVVAEGQLLTMDDHEAVELNFSKGSVETLDQALALLGLEGHTKIVIQPSWSEKLVRALQPLLPILMIIGIGAIYTEIKAPGFGIPGMIGIACLALVFFNQYLVGLAHYTEMMLFMIGFLLLGVEVFVLPGFGVAGISGLLVIVAGLVLSFQGFVMPDPSLPWEAGLMLKNFAMVMGCALGALLVSFFMIRFVLPRVGQVIQGPYLSATLEDAHADSMEAKTVQAGDEGRALTLLRPSGKIEINDQKIDAITQGEFIEPGTRVIVMAVHQNHVIVQKGKDQG